MSNRAAAAKPQQTMTGASRWIDPEHWKESAGLLTAVVLLDQRIAFDVAYESDAYTVVLTPAPAGAPWWMGSWRMRRPDQGEGRVQAKLYRAENGETILVGRWTEDGVEFPWFVELH
jgi:hypothetical protein